MAIDLYSGLRGSGKTTDLLEWMKAAPPDEYRVMICFSHQRAAQVYYETFDQDGTTWAHVDQFVGPDFYRDMKHRGIRYTVFCIDDLDIHIENLFGGVPIAVVSWNLPTSWREYARARKGR